MLDQKNISEKMSKDIDEMEAMLNTYLQFAKTQVVEESSPVNLNNFFQEIIDEKNSANIKINSPAEVTLIARKNALKRCFNNIIENGLTYGKNVYIDVKKSSNRVVVSIEDDGPGVPVNEYKNIFKPFYRLDKSRSLNKSGVGLGMSIVEDVIRSHGGNIQLGDSRYKGLAVKISLPF